MTSVGFINAKYLLLPRSPSGTTLVSSSTVLVSSVTVLVPSGAALVSLSLVERKIWKEERFLKQPLKGKCRSRDLTTTGVAPLFKVWPS